MHDLQANLVVQTLPAVIESAATMAPPAVRPPEYLHRKHKATVNPLPYKATDKV